MVTFTLRQITTIVGLIKLSYEVTNQITAAEGASSAAYVFKTTTQVFSHYASAADMTLWPDSFDEAKLTDVDFYRQTQVVRTWDTVSQMNGDLDTSLHRLQSLADELNAQQGALEIDRTTIIVGA